MAPKKNDSKKLVYIVVSFIKFFQKKKEEKKFEKVEKNVKK